MSLVRKILHCISLVAIASCPTVASAYEVIAHRGLFHDVAHKKNLAENSYEAVVRAYDLGMRGVELDLRLDSGTRVMVFHDMMSNRASNIDNANTFLNSVMVGLNLQRRVDPIRIDSRSIDSWSQAKLKAYGRNSAFLTPGSYMKSLVDMLATISSQRPDIAADKGFMIILDVQDPLILVRAAAAVKKYNMQHNTYLKFFASKALYNTAAYRYNGADTCYNYAKKNNLTGLNLIPQINDGELDISENNDTGITAFQTKLSIEDYLGCWATAQAQHGDAAKMPIVSASVPADNIKAVNGAYRAIRWAKSNNRKTMTIVPNPDAGKMISDKCQLFSFQSNDVAATGFNMNARNAKTSFAADPAVNPTYIIWDVMGDITNERYFTEFNSYSRNLC